GVPAAPARALRLGVVRPGVPSRWPLGEELLRRNLPFIGELELGYQHSYCLNIGITGTNGKTTTTELVERILKHSHRKTVAAGNIGLPLCAVVDQTRELAFLPLQLRSFQLQAIQYLRLVVA